MPCRRLGAVLVTLAVTIGLAWPGQAVASAYSQVLQVLLASQNDTIPPCQFSSATLSAALRQSPTYSYQYGADFTNAVQAALSARAGGRCAKVRAERASGFGSAAVLAGADTRLPGSATAAGAGGLPLVLVVAFGLIGACLIVLIGAWTVSLLGYDPPWQRAARHSVREAEDRLGASLADLADRVRRR